MSATLQRLDQAEVPEIATTLRHAGVAGAGGAGFPTCAKWDRLAEVDYLLVNHQESEPNYYIDKWLGREHPERFGRLFEALLGDAFECIVVAPKLKDRDPWVRPLERTLDPTVYEPDELPIDPERESGIVFAYTDDRYEYGMESVLLRMVADVIIGDDLPMDRGWIVQNTETLHNVYGALAEGDPVTRKLVHVDGRVDEHRFLDVPVGTTGAELLTAAGRDPDSLDDEVLVDGGPGWCFEIDGRPDEFGVTKRTNCVLVLDEDVVAENTYGDDRINVRGELDWAGDHETEPTSLEPERVRVPLITNPAYEGLVARSVPIVETDDAVSEAEMIATPGDGAVGNAQHASIDGTVEKLLRNHVEIEADATTGEASAAADADLSRGVYWTWCSVCGSYVVHPDADHYAEGAHFVCEECR